MQVLKVGGNELDEQAFLTELARAVKSLDEPAVIVHGGGQAIADMQARLDTEPENPRANELAGKAQLMLADFAAAACHFAIAAAAYEHEPDRGRAADLLALANGFEHYARGEVTSARTRWGQIQDRSLRASITDASATP